MNALRAEHAVDLYRYKVGRIGPSVVAWPSLGGMAKPSKREATNHLSFYSHTDRVMKTLDPKHHPVQLD